MSQENVEVVRAGWDAFIRDDLPGIFRHLDPSVVWDRALSPRQRARARGSGLAMDMESAQVATLRNGKVTRIDNYEDRAEALAAAGLRAS